MNRDEESIVRKPSFVDREFFEMIKKNQPLTMEEKQKEEKRREVARKYDLQTNLELEVRKRLVIEVDDDREVARIFDPVGSGEFEFTGNKAAVLSVLYHNDESADFFALADAVKGDGTTLESEEAEPYRQAAYKITVIVETIFSVTRFITFSKRQKSLSVNRG